MTSRLALPRLLLLVLVVAIAAGSGCARIGKMFKKGDKNEGVPVEQLYDKGHQSVMDENFGSASETFQRLIAQYPYGAYAEQAQVEMAFAQFKAGKHDDAISTIDRFIRTYPTHRNTVYMYYLRGLSNSARNTVFLQQVFSLDTSNRDLTAPMQAYNDFSIVAERYPNSRYAADARQRMIYLRNQFARHEVNTGLYYLRRDAWVAAADRSKYLLETYPQSEYQSDALAIMAEAYTRLGNQPLADDAKRVLQQNDPNHPWLSGGWPKDPSILQRLNPFARERRSVSSSGTD